MLSSKTYAIWNLAMAVLCSLFATGNILRGTYWLGISEIVVGIVFVVFCIMAYYGKGIYHKHPVSLYPTGEYKATNNFDEENND